MTYILQFVDVTHLHEVFWLSHLHLVHVCQMGRVVRSVGHLTRKSGVLGLIPGLATYFRFSFRFFKKGSCQLLAKVCARSILVNRLGGLSLPNKSVVRLNDRPDMTLGVYRGRKTTNKYARHRHYFSGFGHVNN